MFTLTWMLALPRSLARLDPWLLESLVTWKIGCSVSSMLAWVFCSMSLMAWILACSMFDHLDNWTIGCLLAWLL
jgi:hypothetical protein